MFTYISGTPCVYSQVSGVAPEHYGVWRGLNVMGLMLGAFPDHTLVMRIGVQRTGV